MDEDKNKEIAHSERKISADEQKIEFKKESEPALEKQEIPSQDKMVAEELKREIEMMELDENLKQEAEEKAKKITFLGDEEKLEHLLAIAKEKGLVYSVKVAKNMNDPFLLDTFHDILAKQGFYQKFAK